MRQQENNIFFFSILFLVLKIYFERNPGRQFFTFWLKFLLSLKLFSCKFSSYTFKICDKKKKFFSAKIFFRKKTRASTRRTWTPAATFFYTTAINNPRGSQTSDQPFSRAEDWNSKRTLEDRARPGIRRRWLNPSTSRHIFMNYYY